MWRVGLVGLVALAFSLIMAVKLARLQLTAEAAGINDRNEVTVETETVTLTTESMRGEITDRKRAATLRKIARARRLPITPELLLTPEEKGHQSVTDPKRGKYLALTLKILPSTLCMLLTASVVLTFKEMSVESVIEGILKLSTLPVVSLRGYAGGYNYKRYKEAPFIESKIRLLEGFLSKS